MRNDLSMALDDCLRRLANGQSAEACLEDYPHIRKELEPLLEIARSIKSLPKAAPTDAFKRISKARLKSRISEEQMRLQDEKPGWREWISAIREWIMTQVFGPNRVLVPVALVVILATCGALFIIFNLTMMSGPSPTRYECTLSILRGSALVQSDEAAGWSAAEDGSRLKAGSRVKTAPDSHVLLTFFEGSSVKLEPDTEIEIRKTELLDNRARMVVGQLAGSTWSSVSTRIPASYFEIQTPDASAVAKGTMFEVEVDQAGFTAVRTLEGTVSVIAQNEEVDVSAGEEVSVEAGSAPSQPRPMEYPESELVITLEGPVAASICDPNGASTGYLPGGAKFAQIPGTRSTSPFEGAQVISLPDPLAGKYTLVLRSIGNGTVVLQVEGRSGGQTVISEEKQFALSSGTEWLVQLNVQLVQGRLAGVSLADVEPLDGRAPEVIVLPEIDGSSSPIPSSGGAGQVSLTLNSALGGSIAEPGEGEFTFEEGETVTLVAEPEQGYCFLAWSGNVADPYAPVTTINVKFAENVTANFVLEES